MTVWKRANTPFEKSDLVEAIGELWTETGDMRLGQLIYNAVVHWNLRNKKPSASRDISRQIFYLEDDDLLTTIALFVRDQYPPKGTASTSS